MKTKFRLPALVVFIAVTASLVVAQSEDKREPDRTGHPPKPNGAPPPQPRGQFGDPLPGLTADELSDFTTGQLQFQEVDTIASGLGPVYNNVSCVACHSTPAIGGASAIVETRFGKMTASGTFDPLTSEGGSLLQQAYQLLPSCPGSSLTNLPVAGSIYRACM